MPLERSAQMPHSQEDKSPQSVLSEGCSDSHLGVDRVVWAVERRKELSGRIQKRFKNLYCERLLPQLKENYVYLHLVYLYVVVLTNIVTWYSPKLNCEISIKKNLNVTCTYRWKTNPKVSKMARGPLLSQYQPFG